MKTRPADVPYCGVRKDVIDKAHPKLNEDNFKLLHSFISRRYSIHKKKDVQCLPAPWTADPILQEFKFTNVRREHDRETRWLLENVVNSAMVYENKLMNCILYRLYNKSTTLELFGGAIDFAHGGTEKSVQDEIRQDLQQALKKNKDYTYFTNAFLTCGLKVSLGRMPETNDEFMPMRIIKFVSKLWNEGIIDKIKQAKTQQDVYKVLKSQYGIGEFLAYQIFVDFTYIQEFPFSENEFTVSGPGCVRGLNEIFKDRDGMTHDECLFWLRDNIDELFWARGWKWNPDLLFNDLEWYDRSMNVMSLENCHCEISKYIRATNGTGRPKNKYKGAK